MSIALSSCILTVWYAEQLTLCFSRIFIGITIFLCGGFLFISLFFLAVEKKALMNTYRNSGNPSTSDVNSSLWISMRECFVKSRSDNHERVMISRGWNVGVHFNVPHHVLLIYTHWSIFAEIFRKRFSG